MTVHVSDNDRRQGRIGGPGHISVEDGNATERGVGEIEDYEGAGGIWVGSACVNAVGYGL